MNRFKILKKRRLKARKFYFYRSVNLAMRFGESRWTKHAMLPRTGYRSAFFKFPDFL
jgi:hypothetical protein